MGPVGLKPVKARAVLSPLAGVAEERDAVSMLG
jgi:hypothetical protein